MRIGVIGTGNMGRALGLRWARRGHQVLFGSRDPNKARVVAAAEPRATEVGDLDEAAAFSNVVLYTVRGVLPSRLLREPGRLSGKILIDCNNSEILGFDVPDPDGRSGLHFTAPAPSLAERLAADAPGARVVKAFNTIAARVIELDQDELAPHRVSVFLCSDDPHAKSVVKGLAEELGFVGVDCGELERSRLVEAAADLVRFLQLGMGRGPFTTISINLLREA